MMLQFEVIALGGERWLCHTDTSRYDFWLGFYRAIKKV